MKENFEYKYNVEISKTRISKYGIRKNNDG